MDKNLKDAIKKIAIVGLLLVGWKFSQGLTVFLLVIYWVQALYGIFATDEDFKKHGLFERETYRLLNKVLAVGIVILIAFMGYPVTAIVGTLSILRSSVRK